VFEESAGGINLQLVGVLGVWFFFVHTSLVLMFSLEKQSESMRSLALYSAFILRRAFRIFPLSVATLILVYTLAALWERNPIVSIEDLPSSVVLANIFLVQNLFGFRDVIGPLWTLPIEVQMYLFLPLFWYLARRVGWKWFAFGVWPVAVMIALAAGHSRSSAWGVVQYAPCFIPGVLSYLLWTGVKRSWAFLTLPITLASLLCGYLLIGQMSQTGGAWIVCLALGLVLPRVREMKAEILRNTVAIIAKYSFGIYLVHEICILLTKEILGAAAHRSLIALVSVLSTAFFSFVAYHSIEAPLIRLGSQVSTRLFRPKRAGAFEAV